MQEASAQIAHQLGTVSDQDIQQTTENQPVVLSDPILCYYVNATKRIQVVRLSHLKEGEWEHILFPAQNFMFEAPPEAMLEVYKSPALSVAPPEYILCRQLQVQSN
jgi:Domain of unknown function (DUF1830)